MRTTVDGGTPPAAAAASRAGVGSCHRRHRRQRGIEGGEPLLPPLSKQGILESTRDDEKASLLTTYSVAPFRIQIDGFLHASSSSQTPNSNIFLVLN